MIKETKIYELPIENTLPYFLQNINCGKTLSKMICKKTDFTSGRFFTILPINIDSGKLLHFDHGGIIHPIIDQRDGSAIINSMDHNCSDFIKNYLNQDANHLAIVENYMLSPESPFAKIPNVKMIPFDSEVYYALWNINSREEVYQTIRKSSLVWHFLLILTHKKMFDSLKLTELMIDQICENAKYVIVNSYDGEGYIYWEKLE